LQVTPAGALSSAAAFSGYLSVLAAGITLHVVAMRSPGRLPALSPVLSHVMQSRTARAGIIVAWAWIGLHFFAR